MKQTKLWQILMMVMVMATWLAPTTLAEDNLAARVDVPRQRIAWDGVEDQRWFWAHLTLFKDGQVQGVAVAQGDNGTELTYRLAQGQVSCVNDLVVLDLEGTLKGGRVTKIDGFSVKIYVNTQSAPPREDPAIGFHFVLELGGLLEQFDTMGGLELPDNPCQ